MRRLVASRRFRYGICGIAIGIPALFAVVYADVRSAGSAIYHDVLSVPSRPVAIVFGAGYSEQALSLVLEDRVRTAVDLYRAGRVKKLLMTGDNSRLNYSEPEAMRRFALRLGVPERAGDRSP